MTLDSPACSPGLGGMRAGRSSAGFSHRAAPTPLTLQRRRCQPKLSCRFSGQMETFVRCCTPTPSSAQTTALRVWAFLGFVFHIRLDLESCDGRSPIHLFNLSQWLATVAVKDSCILLLLVLICLGGFFEFVALLSRRAKNSLLLLYICVYMSHITIHRLYSDCFYPLPR